MLGGQIRYVLAGAVRTRVLEAGSGDPLVLLHGGGGHAESYIRNIIPLSAKFHVYAPDMLGHGFTDAPDVPYTIADLADHLSDLLDAVGAKKAHLLGESLGGWVAAWLALHKPEKVNKLILVTSAGLKLTETLSQQEVEGLARLRNLTDEAFQNVTRESVRKRLEWLFHDSSLVPDELVEVRYRIYSQPTIQRAIPKIIRQSASEAREPFLLTREKLAQIHAPTLILWTRHNPTTPWQIAEQAHRLIEGSQFFIMEDCAHWPQYEKAEQFNRLVSDFLGQ
jgi:pimeloyl-ACP methyl ester carboxylesterase